ncbi:hypothetical protein [Spiroplasma endosymbiont of Lariophagus distinguendus]|uniref:hypothetical protein n=1 Tax=Spiroplasma endosymbiont of Lariophagus distinguendus TaxID=2935082 RepID=UPI00207AA541|nr:hypothetical protein [Spiroplasma endosymbiont of Lariophagus distinguendus]
MNISDLRRIRCLKCHQHLVFSWQPFLQVTNTLKWFYSSPMNNTKHGIPSTDVAKELKIWKLLEEWVIKSELVLPNKNHNLLLRA